MIGGKRIDLYVDTGSFWHKIDPRAKIVWLVCLFLIDLFFIDLRYMLAALIFVLIVLFTSKVHFGRIKYLLILVMVPSLTIIIGYPLVERSGTPLFYLDWPWYHWFWITDVGLYKGFLAFLRCFVLALGALTFMVNTSPEEISTALELFGLNPRLSRIITLTIAFIPVMLSILLSINQAQRARGLDLRKGGLIEKLKKATGVINPALACGVQLIVSSSMVMEARGFGLYERRTSVDEYKLHVKDYALIVVSIGLLAIGIILGYYMRILQTPF